MKKLISSLTFLAFLFGSTFNCLAYDLSDRGRISDIPGRHGSGSGWITFIVILIIGFICNKLANSDNHK